MWGFVVFLDTVLCTRPMMSAEAAMTPFFSAPLLDEQTAKLARADEQRIDALVDQFGCRGGIYFDVGSNVVSEETFKPSPSSMQSLIVVFFSAAFSAA